MFKMDFGLPNINILDGGYKFIHLHIFPKHRNMEGLSQISFIIGGINLTINLL